MLNPKYLIMVQFHTSASVAVSLSLMILFFLFFYVIHGTCWSPSILALWKVGMLTVKSNVRQALLTYHIDDHGTRTVFCSFFHKPIFW